MTTNRPAPNAGNSPTPSNVRGTNGLWLILNRPMTVMITNGASTITRNSFDESPTSELPRMFNSANGQITASATSHRASSFSPRTGKKKAE